MSPAPITLTAKQQDLLAVVAKFGGDRISVLDQQDEMRPQVIDAIRAAYAAGIGGSDIAKALGATRQYVNTVTAQIAKPDVAAESGVQDAARAELRRLNPRWAELRSQRGSATETLISQMGRAQAAGVNPAAIVKASRMASQAGYDALAVTALHTRVQGALKAAGLLGDRNGDNRVAAISRRTTLVDIIPATDVTDDDAALNQAARRAGSRDAGFDLLGEEANEQIRDALDSAGIEYEVPNPDDPFGVTIVRVDAQGKGGR